MPLTQLLPGVFWRGREEHGRGPDLMKATKRSTENFLKTKNLQPGFWVEFQCFSLIQTGDIRTLTEQLLRLALKLKPSGHWQIFVTWRLFDLDRTIHFLTVDKSKVLLLTSAEDLDCTPGFQQKVFHINQPAEFIEDQLVLNLTFSDCKGNNKLRYEVSSPHFKVNRDGSLVALRNISAVGRTLFVHARTPHAEDMAELVIIGGKDIQGSSQDIFKFARTSPIPRQKRSIVVSPILIPENQRQPFPRDVGKVVDSDRPEGSKFRLTGRGVDQEPKGVFRINENTGSVSVTRTLDREMIATYQLFVETTDVNGKTLEGPVPLEVIVIDQNDNRPIFREGPYIGHVMEGSPTGTTVMRMTAFDADDPATDNALLRYNIRQQTPDKPSPNMFYIDPEKGDIVTVVSPALLDREMR
ncbi:cadherin-13 isoform X6 [Castor canadensis]|uniref:Cadherin-13 isoform X6 n=1 Tax=Castor canadensis TaxID=51338 RepID=A0AC58L3E4_CASCN